MAIKSAYELAMERLGKQPGQKLTDEQKSKLAELDRVYTAKIAERELELKPKIAVAGTPEDRQKLEETLRSEIGKLRAKLEEQKEKVRQATK
jgi:Spy/CpxP family protein refolding chaperone